MCTVAAASGAASVRVWHITSRGWDPWTERPLPEVFVLPILQTLSTIIPFWPPILTAARPSCRRAVVPSIFVGFLRAPGSLSEGSAASSHPCPSPPSPATEPLGGLERGLHARPVHEQSAERRVGRARREPFDGLGRQPCSGAGLVAFAELRLDVGQQMRGLPDERRVRDLPRDPDRLHGVGLRLTPAPGDRRGLRAQRVSLADVLHATRGASLHERLLP